MAAHAERGDPVERVVDAGRPRCSARRRSAPARSARPARRRRQPRAPPWRAGRPRRRAMTNARGGIGRETPRPLAWRGRSAVIERLKMYSAATARRCHRHGTATPPPTMQHPRQDRPLRRCWRRPAAGGRSGYRRGAASRRGGDRSEPWSPERYRRARDRARSVYGSGGCSAIAGTQLGLAPRRLPLEPEEVGAARPRPHRRCEAAGGRRCSVATAVVPAAEGAPRRRAR